MSAERDFGGFAFPLMPPCDASGATPTGYPFPENGMTLRDWLAGNAIGPMSAELVRLASEEGIDLVVGIAPLARGLSVISYAIADAMLAERRRP